MPWAPKAKDPESAAWMLSLVLQQLTPPEKLETEMRHDKTSCNISFFEKGAKQPLNTTQMTKQTKTSLDNT